MTYEFLVDTYATERIKVVSVWSEFRDEDMLVRPNATDARGRSVHEQMVHQCVSEDLWFRNMLGIDIGAPPLPKHETRTEFIRQYVNDSGKRLASLHSKDEDWWEADAQFFDVRRITSKEIGIGTVLLILLHLAHLSSRFARLAGYINLPRHGLTG